MADRAGTGFVDILPRLNPASFNAALGSQLRPALDATGKSFASKISSGVKSLSAAVGAPVGALGAVAGVAAIGKLTLGFEDAFTRIGALSNASAEDIARWRDQVLTLSGDTARSPQELADALFFLSSAGLQADQVFPALEASAKAAATGLGSTADVANITASALNAYADTGLTATQVTDTLVAAVREGRAEPDAFADALGRILPIASAAGVGFDEVTGSLAALSNVGLDVNEGVTAMRGLLQALVAPGSQAADTLAEVGVTTEELRQTLSEGGLPAALALLEERTGGNIDTLRKIIPNIRALTGELGLTGQNAEQVAGVFQRVADSTGDAAEAFDKTTQGPGFAFRQLLTKIQNLLLAVGEAVLPIAEKFVAAFSAILGPVTDVVSALSGIPGFVDAVTTALLALIAVKVVDFFRGWTASAGEAAVATTTLETATVASSEASILYVANAQGVVVAQREIAAGTTAAGTAMGGFLTRLKAIAPELILAFGIIKEGTLTVGAAKKAFSGDFEGALRDTAEGMRVFGINVPDLGPTADQAHAAAASFKEITAQLRSGAISGEDAKAQFEALAETSGIDLPDNLDELIAKEVDVVKHNQEMADQVEAANQALADQAEQSQKTGEGLDGLGNKFVGFAERLGLDGEETLTKWREAVVASLTDNGDAVKAFLSDIEGAWNDFKQNAVEGLDFIPDRLQEIEEDGKVTAGGILTAFRKARADTRAFGQDLLKISRTGGQAGKDLAASFLIAGDTIAAEAVAGAPKKLRDNIIEASAKGQDAADRLATKLTNSIVGPLESIEHILKRIAKAWGIPINVNVTGDTAELSVLVNNLGKLRTKGGVQGGGGGTGTGGFDITIGVEGGALGGVTRGASGFLTRGPVFQVGEAGTELVDPLESPRATRLRARSIADALTLLGVGGDMRVHVTVGIDDSGNLQVRRIAQDEVQREARYRDRVPA